MGGSLSHPHSDKPLAEDCLSIDLAEIMRVGRIKAGGEASGNVTWSQDGQPTNSVTFWLDLRTTDTARLILNYNLAPPHGKRRAVCQMIGLSTTEPHFGGRRWWMRCPVTGTRVRKLFLPSGADRFAGRKAWNIGYRVEMLSHFNRPFEKLFRMQRKLGCAQGLGAGLSRPKGMWQRTFARQLDIFATFDAKCAEAIVGLVGTKV